MCTFNSNNYSSSSSVSDMLSSRNPLCSAGAGCRTMPTTQDNSLSAQNPPTLSHEPQAANTTDGTSASAIVDSDVPSDTCARDMPIAGAGQVSAGLSAILDDSAPVDRSSSQSQPQRLVPRDGFIAEGALRRVQSIFRDYARSCVANRDAKREIEKLRKEVEILETERSRDKKMLKQYNHMCSQNEKRAKENMEIYQTMERYHKRQEARLTSKNQALTAERDSLKQQLDDAHAKVREHTRAELSAVVALKIERDNSKKQRQELEGRCTQLQEEVANPPPCTRPHDAPRLRSYSQVSADASTLAEPIHDHECQQSEHSVEIQPENNETINNQTTPTMSNGPKNGCHPKLERLESVQSETLATPLTPQPAPTPTPVFSRYYTDDTLVYHGAETVASEAAAKAAAATKAAATKAAATKAARAIRKAAARAVAHIAIIISFSAAAVLCSV
ncbi:hypothetical protein IWW48_006330 [Coemansia sp. RSA 1200]|nr:hypothetical protein IWW48_006330 [Coemansia sp. RSA 1200]